MDNKEFVSENAKGNTVSSVNQVASNIIVTKSEGAKLKVLFVGNSITRHATAPQIGMAIGEWLHRQERQIMCIRRLRILKRK